MFLLPNDSQGRKNIEQWSKRLLHKVVVRDSRILADFRNFRVRCETFNPFDTKILKQSHKAR